MEKNEVINIYDELYEQAYKVSCIIDVVMKSCYWSDNLAEADALKEALAWQYDLIDMLDVVDSKKDIFYNRTELI